MNVISRFLKKLSILLGRKRFGGELDEEMAFHRQQAEIEFIAGGMTPEAARYAAMRQFGNATKLREQSHEVVGFRMETVVQDLRFALRQLRKNPGFAMTAILILALGIGASVAIFAFVDAALIKPLPYPEPTRLVAVNESTDLFPRNNLSYPDYLDWKRMNTVFSSMEVFTGTGYALSTPTGTEPVPGERVSAGFFRRWNSARAGARLSCGRGCGRRAPVVLLSYRTWQRRFGGRAGCGGAGGKPERRCAHNRRRAPEDFQFALRDNAEFWEPLQPTRECEKRRILPQSRRRGAIERRRLRSECTGPDEIDRTAIGEAVSGFESRQSASVIPLSEAIVGDIRPILLVLLGGAGLLLLIACVNVSSLLLVRAETRDARLRCEARSAHRGRAFRASLSPKG